jgi:hypothetical protein
MPRGDSPNGKLCADESMASSDRDDPSMTANDAVHILARSALAGFGLSAGRDAYRGLKRQVPSWIILGLVFGATGFAVYQVYSRGPGDPPRRWITVLAIVAATLSSAVCIILLYHLFPRDRGVALLLFLGVQGISGYVGFRLGDRRRLSQEDDFEIEQANVRFLRACLRRARFPSDRLRDSSAVGLIRGPTGWHAGREVGAPMRPT